jgi:hypothetical protein
LAIKDKSREAFRRWHDERLKSLDQSRSGWFATWRDLGDYYLPRRVRWLMTANELKGRHFRSKLIDTTSIIAARTCAAGMMSGIVDPSRPWFRLGLQGRQLEIYDPVSIWLDDVVTVMMLVMAESNFYNAMAQCFWDMVIFGTAPVLIYEDFEDVIRCFNPMPGEYYLEQDGDERVCSFYRKITMSVSAIAKRWGKDNLPADIKTDLESGTSTGRERIVCHAYEPMRDEVPLSKSFKYYELYWLEGSPDEEYLGLSGINDPLGLFPRWDTDSGDVYGRGPALDALPDVKQLQQEQKRKAQALDKMVDPPLLADTQLKNQPTTALPGGITYVAGLGREKIGMQSIYDTQFPVGEVREDIQEVQTRIKSILFNDLFLMFQQMQAEPRSAAAVDARREEKMIMLGPVLERFENEGLTPAIERIFGICMRSKLIPPPPPGLQGVYLQPQYESMLTAAQQAASASAIERVFATVGNFAGVSPSAIDKLDVDQAVDEYSRRLGLPPKIINSPDKVAAIRQERAKAQQAQQQAELTPAMVQGAGVLSKTDVGGGQNALAKMMGVQQ